MSSLTFRTAFWAMGLSFAMTIMLLVPNPQKIRMALHARRHPEVFPYEETLVSDLDHPPEIEEAAAEPIADRISLDLPPVRVASADPAAPLGLPAAAPQSPAPSRESAPAFPDEPERDNPAPLNIPVPEPMQRLAQAEPQPLPVPEIPSPQAPQRPEASVEEPPVESPAPAPEQEPALSAAPEPELDLEEFSHDSTITITPGREPHRWNFQFSETELPVVLKLLGRYQGCSVIVDEKLQGTFSGRFLEADPAQAFAVLVKSNNCRLSRRGNILLLTKRTGQEYR